MNNPVLVGIDVGGTFTDFVVVQDGNLRIHKVSTTTDDQSRGIVTGLAELDLLGDDSPALMIVHGMTVATNALLERRGARTALLTTAGFRDVLVIGRQNRPHLYRLHQQRPPAMVADELRLEASERLDHSGAVITPLDERGVNDLAQTLAQHGAESLAICFLFSFRNPDHERRAAALIRARLPDLPISLSSDILPEYREYERTAATVINAYVQPLVARYLARLESALTSEAASNSPHITIMQSNGGTIGLGQASQQAARLVLSGPAGGVVGAFAVAQNANPPGPHNIKTPTENDGLASWGGAVNLITFDMGGTSTDVALCPGQIPTTAESVIADLPLRLPIIDIHTVGAGGGSIAFVDAGGGLRVGPRSAGAHPGPVCYGRGGAEPTVTDANLVLGRLDAGGFLGGRGDVSLDVSAAQRALAVLGRRLGLTTEQAGLGVVRVANATMEMALRRVSVERGFDPRQFTLLPFGGAGPLHACDLANALGIRRILIPRHPGVLSAYGMLAAGLSTDASQSLLRTMSFLRSDDAELRRVFAGLDERVRALLANDGVANPTISASLDMRYRGQSYELTTPLSLPITEAALAAAETDFHALHARRYGYDLAGETVEVVTLRVRAAGPGARLTVTPRPLAGADASPARLDDRLIWFDAAGPVNAACYNRLRLAPGNRLIGPALILQYDATTLIAPGWEGVTDEQDNLWLLTTNDRLLT